MAQKLTKEQRRKARIAAKQLNTKLKLERQLSNKSRKFLRKMNREFLRRYENSGIVLNADEFSAELRNILDKHYWKTAKKFSPIVIDEINTVLSDAGYSKIDKNDPTILSALFLFINQNIGESTRKITSTSNKEIRAALVKNDNDGRQAYRALNNRAITRGQTIGVTETQKAAEGSKSTSAKSAQEGAIAGAIVTLTMKSFKEWVPRFDAKVRAAHEAARFQLVENNEPFIVGGEFLMYPGDTSLGASLWNIINCRCVVIYSFRII